MSQNPTHEIKGLANKTFQSPTEAALIRSVLSKPFCILTGGSGTGKTQLAIKIARWLSKLETTGGDCFRRGTIIPSGRIDYYITNSDSLSVEFWNNLDESKATKVVLPRAIIREWVESIKRNGFNQDTRVRTIRENTQDASQYSNNLHSFETHLKAAAMHLINHESQQGPDNLEKQNFAIVPVGADWTDNRNVLGFVNHLRDDGEKKKRPIYQSTKVLDLLLDANQNPAVPYFLILDEMNLSHVERYFADFLSTMEQKEGKLRLHDEGPREELDCTLPRFADDETGVPRELRYPQNLFVIGTVNIDETTYMFSPKVLDRANVIEFTVDESDINEFLEDPGPYPEIEKAADGMAEAFLGLALKARNDKPEDGLEALPSTVKEAVNEHILDLFKILKAGRFEFAFRSSNEVLRYLKVCRHLSEDKSDWDAKGWQSDLDDQILQKLLPKLHGSLGRIGKLLAELASYCEKGKLRNEDETPPKLKSVSELDPQNAAFPKSLKKLQSMAATVLDEQFVSFIH